ncbi:cryptochrome/photolyase family protein [Kaistella jeonii]|uniref:Deoxyribodipyrimidine photolyase n=1 Tax=Kaistella jeonii TaxID=266749 RepID=A0A0C1CWD3_9FLAO|nr:deoxyribodipyrimidine photo-lyase [Kaistella jeonii]KIA88701.1 deoxyribodipyrimidine photolyase [Kaistella jeonii]SFC10447.1 deoxyribodipyrimidine photo-lyase [Kaistella jeonii]VEI95279.1 Deoxyribodipyrimidine photo-lyase [Kaistella jeonii]
MPNRISIFWFRRDLRLSDNHGLFKALESSENILPIFIFDEEILSKLDNKEDKRVDFIFQALETLNIYLAKSGKAIKILHGNPLNIFKDLVKDSKIESVFCNEDYEPSAIQRDKEIDQFLKENDIHFYTFKDQVHFHKDDILKSDGTPYTIYTPYSKQWLIKYNNDVETKSYPSEKLPHHFINVEKQKITLEKIGFKKTDYEFKIPKINRDILKTYHETRNFPTTKTSEMSVHLRFGTISVRKLAAEANHLNETYLKELIWREFFMQILYHFPKVIHESFKRKYDKIAWLYDDESLKKWQEGKTGYPIVDAGMRELNETGFMHNRVRMVCASFFTKHLLMDWRIGEAYFAEKLLDYDLSANNGNWQWSAGTGCDSAPYFRVFNPEEQQKKFDPEFKYIKKWVKEFGTKEYPQPMIDHKFARLRALETYKKGLQE